MLTNRATRLEVSQGQQTYVRYGFLLVCFVPKTRRFFRYSISKKCRDLEILVS